MTDARAEMRKNVREIIARGCGCDRPCGDRMSVLDCGCLNDADAAIALALEEAARCADNAMSSNYSWNDACVEIANAIRALKSGT